MSDLYDILNPWGPSGAGGPGAGGTSDSDLLGSSILEGDASRMCLDRAVLPPVYAVAYSAGLKAGGGRITREALQRVLAYSGLPRHITGQITLAADTGAPMMSQRDFNLALAMTALAQKNMSPSIENVVFHKDDLPEPDLKGVEVLATENQSADSEVGGSGQDPEGSPAYPTNSDDPWFSTSKGSTAMAAPTSAMAAMTLSGDGNVSSSTPRPPPYSSTNGQKSSGRASVSNGTNAQSSVPSINMERVQWQLDLEDVSIKESAEKGGIVFKHTNYEVSTRSFTAMVVRRYNDFFWISNYLVKRYPYRMHPNIPPKGFPVGNLDTDAEELDPNEEAGDTPWAEIKETYVGFDDFYGQVIKDEEKYRAQITSLEKIARYKQAIGDELCTYSDTLRHTNAPLESTTGSAKFLVLSKAKRTLTTNLNELSMSFSDVSLLEKSQGEVLKAISAEYLRRLYDIVISMKLMMDRVRLFDRSKEIQR
ncbi:Sorting nexin mvp1, partial [Coemansia sp. IMI 209127]